MGKGNRSTSVRSRARSKSFILGPDKPRIRSSSDWPASTAVATNCWWRQATGSSRKPRPHAGRNAFPRKPLNGFSRKLRQNSEDPESGGPGQSGRGPGQGFAAGALLTGGEHARQYAVKLLDREVLADVTVGAGTEGGMHPFLVVTD